MALKRSSIVLSRLVSNKRWCFQRSISMDDDGSLVNPMQTKVSLLNKEDESGIFIDAFSVMGFRLNTGVQVIGPIAVFPKTLLHWNVRGIDDVDEDSVSLFTMIDPKPDVFLLGVGEKSNLTELNLGVIRYLKEKKINIEILSTESALATFNFLNAEKRFVAGAFLPPGYKKVKVLKELGNSSSAVELTNVKGDDEFKRHKTMLESRKVHGRKDNSK